MHPSMVRRGVVTAGIDTPIGCHSFRATGITDNLTNGGGLEVAQRMTGQCGCQTSGLYNRRSDDVDLSEVASIGIWGGSQLSFVRLRLCGGPVHQDMNLRQSKGRAVLSVGS